MSIVDNNYFDDLKNTTINDVEYDRVFLNHGEHGIVGFVYLQNKKKRRKVVFKLSNRINRNVEHESTILSGLNNLKQYCPHFVYFFGTKVMNISEEFIYDPCENELCDNEDGIPKQVMFIEYLEKLPFYRLYRKCSDKNLVISQVSQILLALHISQLELNFTHYDLHLGNILLQKCEYDSLFLYKIKDEYLCIPTFGFYPVIIDTGISYSNSLLDKPMYSNVDSYDYGFQSTIFDELDDVHHLLISLFYDLEVENDNYNIISNRLKYIFRNIPILRKTGWKKLPYDISEIVLNNLRKYKQYESMILFREYKYDILELLNGLIKMPLQDYGNEDLTCLVDFMLELQKLCNVDECYNKDMIDDDILHIIKTIIDKIYELSLDEFMSGIQNILYKYDLPFERVDLKQLYDLGKVVSLNLSTTYFRIRNKNDQIIREKYEKTLINSPFEMFIYLVRNITPNYRLANNMTIYVWDYDNKSCNKKVVKNVLKRELNRINILPFLERGNEIVKLI